jgi:hypothetical protein
MRFAGILGYIFCGITVIGGVLLAILVIAIDSLTDELGGLSVVLIILVYIPMGAFYFFPSRFIYNFGAKIQKYMIKNYEWDLEQAFKYNKSFWKFVGILCIVLLAVVPLSIVFAIIGGIAAVFSGIFF